MNVFDEFKWRNIIYDHTNGLEEHIINEKVTAYIGFDPSASSLHIGSFLPIMALARLQQYGHTPIALAGGGTGLIGDPSGKFGERAMLTKEDVESNILGIKEQLSRFLDFKTKSNPAILVNNADWLTNKYLIDFLRDIGRFFTVNYMIAKESVKRRFDQDDGISYTEFSYMLLQAFDFLFLYDKYNCTFQLGGSDQWGNITAGIELIRKKNSSKSYGMVLPLVTTSSGTKFGKTEVGTIWLDSKRTSPYRFYQFWLNTDDRDVIQYLKYFTWFDKDKIDNLEDLMKKSPERRDSQKNLAKEVTRMVHGNTELENAQRASDILFGKEIKGVSSKDILDIFSDVPSTSVPKTKLSNAETSLVDILEISGLASSKSNARRLIQGGGIYINNNRINDVRKTISLFDSIDGKYLVLRKGKKEYHLIKILH